MTGITGSGYSFLFAARWLSPDGCSSGDGYGHVLCVLQNKFPHFNRDLLNRESFQQMRSKPIRQCLNEADRVIAHKILSLFGNGSNSSRFGECCQPSRASAEMARTKW